MTQEYYSDYDIANKSVSKEIVLKSKPFVDLFLVGNVIEQKHDACTMYAMKFYYFHTRVQHLSREYLYGGVRKTLCQYERDWADTLFCLTLSTDVTDIAQSHSVKGVYPPLDSAVLSSVRDKCRELGDIRGLILKHQQRIWRANHGK